MTCPGFTGCCQSTRCRKFQKKVKQYFFFNGIHRFHLEIYLDLLMLAMLNIFKIDSSYDGDTMYNYSMVLAFLIAIILITLPIVNIAVYCYCFSKIRDEGP